MFVICNKTLQFMFVSDSVTNFNEQIQIFFHLKLLTPVTCLKSIFLIHTHFTPKIFIAVDPSDEIIHHYFIFLLVIIEKLNEQRIYFSVLQDNPPGQGYRR